MERLKEFLTAAEEGEEPMEVLLVLFALFMPVYLAFSALEEILAEFLAFQTSVLTSPFF